MRAWIAASARCPHDCMHTKSGSKWVVDGLVGSAVRLADACPRAHSKPTTDEHFALVWYTVHVCLCTTYLHHMRSYVYGAQTYVRMVSHRKAVMIGSDILMSLGQEPMDMYPDPKLIVLALPGRGFLPVDRSASSRQRQTAKPTAIAERFAKKKEIFIVSTYKHDVVCLAARRQHRVSNVYFIPRMGNHCLSCVVVHSKSDEWRPNARHSGEDCGLFAIQQYAGTEE